MNYVKKSRHHYLVHCLHFQQRDFVTTGTQIVLICTDPYNPHIIENLHLVDKKPRNTILRNLYTSKHKAEGLDCYYSWGGCNEACEDLGEEIVIYNGRE